MDPTRRYNVLKYPGCRFTPKVIWVSNILKKSIGSEKVLETAVSYFAG